MIKKNNQANKKTPPKPNIQKTQSFKILVKDKSFTNINIGFIVIYMLMYYNIIVRLCLYLYCMMKLSF